MGYSPSQLKPAADGASMSQQQVRTLLTDISVQISIKSSSKGGLGLVLREVKYVGSDHYQITIGAQGCILYPQTGKARPDSQRRRPWEDGQVFLSQEAQRKPTLQSKNWWGQEAVRSQGLQGPGSGHNCSRSGGLATPPFLSSSVVATEALSRPVCFTCH